MRKQPADVVNERKPLVGLFDLSVYYAITSFSILSGLLGFFFAPHSPCRFKRSPSVKSWPQCVARSRSVLTGRAKRETTEPSV